MQNRLDFSTLAELTHPAQYDMNQAVLLFSADKLRMDILQQSWVHPGLAQIIECTNAKADFLVEWILSILPACLNPSDTPQVYSEITQILSTIDSHFLNTRSTRIISAEEFTHIIGRLIDKVVYEINLSSPAFTRAIQGRNIHSCLRLSDSLYRVTYV